MTAAILGAAEVRRMLDARGADLSVRIFAREFVATLTGGERKVTGVSSVSMDDALLGALQGWDWPAKRRAP